MIQPKIQTVYLPDRKDDCFEAEHIQDIDGDFYLKESLITFTPEEFKTFKRQWALEVLNKAKDTDINTAWHNIKRELQFEFENKI